MAVLNGSPRSSAASNNSPSTIHTAAAPVIAIGPSRLEFGVHTQQVATGIGEVEAVEVDAVHPLPVFSRMEQGFAHRAR
ncbi:hypothetical protein GCM10027521_06380 [Amycolatopsis cihanbeyliensis]